MVREVKPPLFGVLVRRLALAWIVSAVGGLLAAYPPYQQQSTTVIMDRAPVEQATQADEATQVGGEISDAYFTFTPAP